MKKAIALVLTLVLALSLCGFAAKNEKVIKVGATPMPHAEILEFVKDAVAAEGYTLEVIEFNDYVIPNTSLEEGELDANFFQHIKYMNEFNEEHGTHLVSAVELHYEPLGLYAAKSASLEDIKDGAQIAVPNDTTNEARALLLLEQEGLIKLEEGAGLFATKESIVENPHNIKIVEMNAELVTSTLKDVDFVVVNGNYALEAGLKIADALAIEAPDGNVAIYVNIVAVKEGNEESEKTQVLQKVLLTDAVKDFINETYQGAVVPVF